MPSRSLSSPPLRNPWTRLARVSRACQALEEAALNEWLRTRTVAELDDLGRLGEVCKAVNEGLLPDDAWTQEQGGLWTEAMSKARQIQRPGEEHREMGGVR